VPVHSKKQKRELKIKRERERRMKERKERERWKRKKNPKQRVPRGSTGARECFGKHFPSSFPRSGPQPERLVKSHQQEEEETHFTTHFTASTPRQTPPPPPPPPPPSLPLGHRRHGHHQLIVCTLHLRFVIQLLTPTTPAPSILNVLIHSIFFSLSLSLPLPQKF